MAEVLAFEPLLWVMRILVILFGILLNLVMVSAIIRMAPYLYEVVFDRRNLPEVGEVSWKAFGHEFAYKARMDSARDEQLRILNERLENLEQASVAQADALDRIIGDLLGGEGENAW